MKKWPWIAIVLLGTWLWPEQAPAQEICQFVELINVAPEEGEVVDTTTPTLEAVAGQEPDAFLCEHLFTQWIIATDEKLQHVVYNSEADADHLFDLPVPAGILVAGGSYYWSARPLNETREGAWSAFTSFSVASGQQPSQGSNAEEFDPGAPRRLQRLLVLFPGESAPVLITVEVVNGIAIFEGDIILGRVDGLDAEAARDAVAGPSPQGIGIRIAAGNLWPGGVVPYVIHPGMDATMQGRIQQAIQHWQANTSISFVNRTGEADYVVFVPGGGCASYVSRVGGPQDIVLNTNCSTGNVIHEIGHAIGLFHEQSRCDRDRFVTILWANIQPNKESNFSNACTAGADLGSYDYGSVMHYPALAFSATGLPTIQTIPPGIPLGQRDGLSTGDIAATQALYGSAPPPAPPPMGNHNPTVTLTYAPADPSLGDTIRFTATAQDPDGDPLAYQWFVNGAEQPANAPQAEWPDAPAGTHTVTVRVLDGRGGAAEATVQVTVGGGAPLPPQPGGDLTLEQAIDVNGNGVIDDGEILRAIEYWIRNQEVPNSGGKKISDVKILELLRLWIQSTPIPAPARPATNS